MITTIALLLNHQIPTSIIHISPFFPLDSDFSSERNSSLYISGSFREIKRRDGGKECELVPRPEILLDEKRLCECY